MLIRGLRPERRRLRGFCQPASLKAPAGLAGWPGLPPALHPVLLLGTLQAPRRRPLNLFCSPLNLLLGLLRYILGIIGNSLYLIFGALDSVLALVDCT